MTPSEALGILIDRTQRWFEMRDNDLANEEARALIASVRAEKPGDGWAWGRSLRTAIAAFVDTRPVSGDWQAKQWDAYEAMRAAAEAQPAALAVLTNLVGKREYDPDPETYDAYEVAGVGCLDAFGNLMKREDYLKLPIGAPQELERLDGMPVEDDEVVMITIYGHLPQGMTQAVADFIIGQGTVDQAYEHAISIAKKLAGGLPVDTY